MLTFHVIVLWRAPKKWTKNYNARVHIHFNRCRWVLLIKLPEIRWTAKEWLAKQAQSKRKPNRTKTKLKMEKIPVKVKTVICNNFTRFPAISSQLDARKSIGLHIVRVTSAEELGTKSRNLRVITLGVRSVWAIHSFTLIVSCLGFIRYK